MSAAETAGADAAYHTLPHAYQKSRFGLRASGERGSFGVIHLFALHHTPHNRRRGMRVFCVILARLPPSTPRRLDVAAL